MTNNVIPESDDRLFSYFLKEVLVGLFSGSDINNRNKKNDLGIYFVLGLMLVVATEPFKVILRKDIGKLSLSFPRLITACILYFIWAGILFGVANSNDYQEYATGLNAGAFFYLLFGLFVLVLGIKENDSAKLRYQQSSAEIIKHIYRGHSIFFMNQVRKNGGFDVKTVWLKTEPITCFCIGLMLTLLPAFIHPIYLMIGIPLLLTAISFWFNEWFQINNVWDVQTNKILREKHRPFRSHQHHEQEDEFSDVG